MNDKLAHKIASSRTAEKPKTLKQLEAELVHYEELILHAADHIDNNYHMAFRSGETGKALSYEEIQNIPVEERYSSALKIANDVEFDKELSVDDCNVHKAMRVLYLLGFRSLAASVNKMTIDFSMLDFYRNKIEDLKNKIEQKRINSKGGKGRTSRHKELALKIATDTWGLTPGASMESLSRKIHYYLDKQHTDVPEPGTLKTWLKESGLNPNVLPKIKNYELVIKSPKK